MWHVYQIASRRHGGYGLDFNQRSSKSGSATTRGTELGLTLPYTSIVLVGHLGNDPSQARCYGIYSPGRVLNGILTQICYRLGAKCRYCRSFHILAFINCVSSWSTVASYVQTYCGLADCSPLHHFLTCPTRRTQENVDLILLHRVLPFDLHRSMRSYRNGMFGGSGRSRTYTARGA